MPMWFWASKVSCSSIALPDTMTWIRCCHTHRKHNSWAALHAINIQNLIQNFPAFKFFRYWTPFQKATSQEISYQEAWETLSPQTILWFPFSGFNMENFYLLILLIIILHTFDITKTKKTPHFFLQWHPTMA